MRPPCGQCPCPMGNAVWAAGTERVFPTKQPLDWLTRASQSMVLQVMPVPSHAPVWALPALDTYAVLDIPRLVGCASTACHLHRRMPEVLVQKAGFTCDLAMD